MVKVMRVFRNKLGMSSKAQGMKCGIEVIECTSTIENMLG